MSHGSEGSVRAIFYALGANFGIAVAKYVAAFWTGSGSMLAEAIHSTADCANQMLLLLGLKQARRPASADFPHFAKQIHRVHSAVTPSRETSF